MDTLGFKAMTIQDMLTPMVALFVREINPKKDEISKNKAFKDYGRAWIEDQIERGNLCTRRKGNVLLVSRAAVELLKKAETSSAEFLIKR